MYYYATAEREVGPVGAERLVELFDAGVVGPEDRVRLDGTTTWRAAHQIVAALRGRAPLRAPAPPAPPPIVPAPQPAATVADAPPVADPVAAPRGRTRVFGTAAAALVEAAAPADGDRKTPVQYLANAARVDPRPAPVASHATLPRGGAPVVDALLGSGQPADGGPAPTTADPPVAVPGASVPAWTHAEAFEPSSIPALVPAASAIRGSEAGARLAPGFEAVHGPSRVPATTPSPFETVPDLQATEVEAPPFVFERTNATLPSAEAPVEVSPTATAIAPPEEPPPPARPEPVAPPPVFTSAHSLEEDAPAPGITLELAGTDPSAEPAAPRAQPAPRVELPPMPAVPVGGPAVAPRGAPGPSVVPPRLAPRTAPPPRPARPAWEVPALLRGALEHPVLLASGVALALCILAAGLAFQLTASLQGEPPPVGSVTTTESTVTSIGRVVLKRGAATVSGTMSITQRGTRVVTVVSDQAYRVAFPVLHTEQVTHLQGQPAVPETKDGPLSGRTLLLQWTGAGWKRTFEDGPAGDLATSVAELVVVEDGRAYPPGRSWAGRRFPGDVAGICRTLGVDGGCEGSLDVTVDRLVRYHGERSAQLSYRGTVKGRMKTLRVELDLTGTIFRSTERSLDLEHQAKGTIRLTGEIPAGPDGVALMDMEGPVDILERSTRP